MHIFLRFLTTAKTLSMIWLLISIFGVFYLFQYSAKPGASSKNSTIWPVGSHISKPKEKNTLVIFAHPHCPCSKATIRELERLIPHIKDKVDMHVVFVKPKNKNITWVKGSLWKQVQSLPSVHASIDQDGFESKVFGAKTSGQVYFYNSNNKLVFSGGITPSRGHEGDSLGRKYILDAIQSPTDEIKISQVFGCALVGDQS